ncbi:hypothetical protein C8F04DRAFT_946822, partial [Mycena alexandri]
MSDPPLYSLALMPKRLGYPLYRPSPPSDLPEHVRRSGTQIGDVGVVCSDGSFDPIFNICRTENDPANRFGVPISFAPLVVRPEDIRTQVQFHPPGSVISNVIETRKLFKDHGQPDAVVEDSTNSKQRALLLLPDGASSWDLHRSHTFRDFALKHAQNWYAFVNDTLQRMVGSSDLYLVTGVTKCASWRITTVDNCSNS